MKDDALLPVGRTHRSLVRDVAARERRRDPAAERMGAGARVVFGRSARADVAAAHARRDRGGIRAARVYVGVLEFALSVSTTATHRRESRPDGAEELLILLARGQRDPHECSRRDRSPETRSPEGAARETCGVITFISTHRERTFDDDDLILAQDVAQRTAPAKRATRHPAGQVVPAPARRSRPTSCSVVIRCDPRFADEAASDGRSLACKPFP